MTKQSKPLTQDITITEVKQLKEQCELYIWQIIQQLEHKTGCIVTDIKFSGEEMEDTDDLQISGIMLSMGIFNKDEIKGGEK